METVYRKVGRKYIPVGYNNIPDMTDGIWLVQRKPESRSMSSIFWKVGDLKRPVDIVTHCGLQTLEDDLSQYLLRLTEKDSKEFKELKELCGDWVKEPIGFYNISISQMLSLIFRRMALHLEEGETKSWDTLQFEFRNSIDFEELRKMEPIAALYAFTKWLKDNNVKFRQGKNIG